MNSQWTIGRLFLWLLMVALICSHLAGIYQKRIVGFTDFTIDSNSIEQWIIELDPTGCMKTTSEGEGRHGDVVDSDLTFYLKTKNSTSDEIIQHVRRRIHERLQEEKWTVHGGGIGSDSFSFHTYSGDTRFRIYGWILPYTEIPFALQPVGSAERITKIKLLRTGYQTR